MRLTVANAAAIQITQVGDRPYKTLLAVVLVSEVGFEVDHRFEILCLKLTVLSVFMSRTQTVPGR